MDGILSRIVYSRYSETRVRDEKCLVWHFDVRWVRRKYCLSYAPLIKGVEKRNEDGGLFVSPPVKGDRTVSGTKGVVSNENPLPTASLQPLAERLLTGELFH